MKIERFFALAKEKGITACQVFVTKGKTTTASIFHHEIDNYSICDTVSLIAAGIYNGKFGSCRTQKSDDSAFAYLVDGIIDSASLNEKDEVPEIFKGSDKYCKKNLFNKDLANEPIEDKIALIKKIELDLFAFDKKITEVDSVSYEETEGESEFYNSYGLKVKSKKNYFVISAGVVAKKDEEIKTNGDFVFGNDLHKFNEEAFVSLVATPALKKLGGEPCVASKYPTVIKNNVFSSLMAYFLSQLSAEGIQKKSSPLVGKLHTKVASVKINMAEKSTAKNVFFSSFDDEGVAKKNLDIIKRGVLMNYFYNNETAKKDGVASTGNAAWQGDKIGIDFNNVFIKGSSHSFDEMISPIQEGVYITDVAGLGTGMNAQSGDFSCQAEGFMIEKGKLTKPLNLITLSGNLGAMLMNVRAVDNDVKLTPETISAPDVYVSKMSIGGK